MVVVSFGGLRESGGSPGLERGGTGRFRAAAGRVAGGLAKKGVNGGRLALRCKPRRTGAAVCCPECRCDAVMPGELSRKWAGLLGPCSPIGPSPLWDDGAPPIGARRASGDGRCNVRVRCGAGSDAGAGGSGAGAKRCGAPFDHAAGHRADQCTIPGSDIPHLQPHPKRLEDGLDMFLFE